MITSYKSIHRPRHDNAGKHAPKGARLPVGIRKHPATHTHRTGQRRGRRTS